MSIEKGKNYTGCISEEDKKNIRNHIADLNADKAGLAAMIDCLSKEIAELKKQREPVVAESPYVVVNENGNYMRVNPKREPLSDYDVVEEYVTTIKEEPWTRIKAYFAGVRFAEKYHGIGGEDV